MTGSPDGVDESGRKKSGRRGERERGREKAENTM
jgi:hypothetical protein